MAVRPETTNHRIVAEGNLVLAASLRTQKVFGHASARTGLQDREATAGPIWSTPESTLMIARCYLDSYPAPCAPSTAPGWAAVRVPKMAGPGRLRNAVQIAAQTPLRDAERH